MRPTARLGQLGSGFYNLDAELNEFLLPITNVSVQPQASTPQFGKLGSGTYGLDDAFGVGFMTLDPNQTPPRSVRAGDFDGSLERIARAQLPGASQHEINNYVGQLFEINDITDARKIGANQNIVPRDVYTPMATSGLQRYGQDIALGEQIKTNVIAVQAERQVNMLRDPETGELASFADLSRKSRATSDAAYFAARQNSLAPRALDYAPVATVSPTYKAISSVLGMVSDGLGMVAGWAMTVTGLGLTITPEPTTLTKWAGVPLTAFGATYTTKSAVGFGLNFTNFVTALKGSTLESAYMPGSALEWAVRAGGGSPEAERVAVAADLAWGLAGGRVLDARLATGIATNPRVAALLQPALVTSVGKQATILAPNAWNAVTRIEPRIGLLDLGFKVNDNIAQPLMPGLQNK